MDSVRRPDAGWESALRVFVVLERKDRVNRDQALDQIGTLAARRLDLDVVLLGLADERPAQRRGERDAVGGAIDLLRHHDLVFDADALVEVFELDAAAQPHRVARDRVEIDARKLRYSLLEVGHARAQKFLALLGHRPLGVLREIAVSACPLQLLGQFHGQLALEILHVLAQPLDYWKFSHCSPEDVTVYSQNSSKGPDGPAAARRPRS